MYIFCIKTHENKINKININQPPTKKFWETAGLDKIQNNCIIYTIFMNFYYV